MMGLALTAIVPAILLFQAATLLGRSREVDLSLDHQCFFVVILQICFFSLMPDWLAVVVSAIVLAAVLILRILFTQFFSADSMIVSIAVGTMLIGVSFLLIWLFQLGSNYPAYKSTIPVRPFAILSFMIAALFLVLDRFVSRIHHFKVPISPIGGVPRKKESILLGIFPAAVLVTLAGSIFALHAGSATQNFSHNFGILGATASLIAFGRIQKASVLGLILALIYIGGIYLGTSEFIKSMEHVALIQSFGVPILSLAIMGTLSLIINRP